MTANTEKGQYNELMRCGNVDCLSKPFRSAEVLQQLDRLLRNKKSASASPTEERLNRGSEYPVPVQIP